MKWMHVSFQPLTTRWTALLLAAACLTSVALTPLSFAESTPLKGGVEQSGKMDGPLVNEDDLKTLEPGTQINMALTTTLNTAFINTGDSFFAKVTQDYKVDGKTVIPKGTMMHGVCEEQQGPKRAGRNAYVTTRFDYLITPDGREIPIEGKYTNKDSAGKAAAKVIGRSAGYTALGGVIGALMVFKYGGLAAVAASNGYALAGGAAIGGAVGLGSALATKGKHQLITPGDELTVRLREPIVLPTMIMPAADENNYLPDGLTVLVKGMKVENDPFGEASELTLMLDVENRTDNTFTTFDVVLEDDHGSTFYPSPFGDTGMWFTTLKPNSRWVGNLSFNVDNPRLTHQLVFYKHYSREPLGKVAIEINGKIPKRKAGS